LANERPPFLLRHVSTGIRRRLAHELGTTVLRAQLLRIYFEESSPLGNEIQYSGEERYATALDRTFRQAHRISQRLLLEHIDRKDGHLREVLSFALENQTTSEYPFVFNYSFCNDERDGEQVARLAGAVHLLQTSTLITDDIFDFAELRYHYPTIHRRYDVSYAVIAAELLQSIAMECISSELERHSFRNQRLVLKLFHQIIKDLYLGQYLDVYNTSNLRMTTRDYQRVIELGAGYFFKNLAQCGALLGNKSKAAVESLATYGYHYGMALFITDDIVDIVQKPAATGKSFAPDLKGRKMRLPMILALRLGARKDVVLLKKFLRSKDNSRTALLEAAKRIRKSRALQACRIVANDHLDRSLESLAAIEGSLAAKSLSWLSQSLLRAQGLESEIPEFVGTQKIRAGIHPNRFL